MATENLPGPLRRGVLEIAVLLCVAEAPRHGPAILRSLDELSDLGDGEGAIYPLLSRLAREGTLAADWLGSGDLARKYYRLTDAGRRRLDRMLGRWEDVAVGMSRLIAAHRGNLPR